MSVGELDCMPRALAPLGSEDELDDINRGRPGITLYQSYEEGANFASRLGFKINSKYWLELLRFY